VAVFDLASAKYSIYLKLRLSGRSAMACGVDLLKVAFKTKDNNTLRTFSWVNGFSFLHF
jgi:hypothetical protein